MKIKKILLIHPPAFVKKSWVEEILSFPLGLASISAVLSQKSYEVKILDCFIEDINNRESINDEIVRIGLPDNDIIKIIEEYKPDIIGISIQFSIQLKPALHINQLIKFHNPDIITVCGGNHASAAPESILNTNIDWLIVGEGEFRFIDLIKAIESNNIDSLPDEIISVKETDSIDFNTQNIDKIQNLDLLPMPRYDLLPLDKYWTQNLNGGSKWANIFLTRGCPFNCVFCSIHTIMGKKVRYKSVEIAVKEIEYLNKELNIGSIYIEDDNISQDIDWAKSFFSEIINKELIAKYYLRNGVRADRLDYELLRLMKKAGVQSISLAPESGSQETLNNIIKKKMKLEDVEKAVKMASKVGIYTLCYLVIGFPEENLDDINKTIKYASKLKRFGCDNVYISCAVPYPGTKLYKNCIERGIIDESNIDYNEMATMGSIIHNEWYTANELKEIRDEAMKKLTSNLKMQFVKSFFTNPVLFLQKTKNIISRRI